jgi:RNA polymerase sigma-70 factor (ECF subfamily)
VTEPDATWLTRGFEEHRSRLRAVAYRMLGSGSEAEDAVQEAWLRLDRTDADRIQNLGGWLTTVVARVCLDMLRSRRSRREDRFGPEMLEMQAADDHDHDPQRAAVLADSVGLALVIVLDTLAPIERVAFVLHDMFAVPFAEIGPIIERSPAAARQLASRARRRLQGSTVPDADLSHNRAVVDAFLAAARDGDFPALVAALHPDVVLRADAAGVKMGASALTRGAKAVAATFSGRARAARPALVDNAAGAVWGKSGQPRVVFEFSIVDGRIAAIDLLADRETVAQLDISVSHE